MKRGKTLNLNLSSVKMHLAGMKVENASFWRFCGDFNDTIATPE